MSIKWRTVTGARNPRFLVAGTVLNTALVAGSRYCIEEIRTYEGKGFGNPSRRYVVRDAHTVSDADVKAGKRPEIVLETDSIITLTEFIASNN